MNDSREVIEAAQAAWNAHADNLNTWSELGCDEKLELVAKEAERQALERAALQVESLVQAADAAVGTDAFPRWFYREYERMAKEIRALKEPS